jgi:hypothetical protein
MPERKRMGRTFTLRTLTTCLWPGLAPLWWRGRWRGLAEAVAFAAVLNLLLVATFVWPMWIARPWPLLGWLACGGFWLVACWRSLAKLPTLVDDNPDTTQGLLIEAQTHYLKGHWYEAEKAISQLLNRRPRDGEGLLLLATLMRHTQRYDEATATLDRLEQLTTANRWRLEIIQERQRIENLKQEKVEEGPPS